MTVSRKIDLTFITGFPINPEINIYCGKTPQDAITVR